MPPRPLALVIEDADDAREVYADVLALEGFAVEQARNGQEGFDKAAELIPDIVITDLSMPVMDGWEAIRRLRADERTRRIPIIVCSGQSAPDVLRDLQVDALLNKPFTVHLLVREVQRILRRDAAA